MLFSPFRCFVRNSGCTIVRNFTLPKYCISTSRISSQNVTKDTPFPQDKDKPTLPDEVVFYHPGHDAYVCWHPEVSFPYEMTKPLPLEYPKTDSELKVSAMVPVKEFFRKKDERLKVQELMKLTYTAKYKWLGRYGKKKKYVLRDMDPLKERRNRKYL